MKKTLLTEKQGWFVVLAIGVLFTIVLGGNAIRDLRVVLDHELIDAEVISAERDYVNRGADKTEVTVVYRQYGGEVETTFRRSLSALPVLHPGDHVLLAVNDALPHDVHEASSGWERKTTIWAIGSLLFIVVIDYLFITGSSHIWKKQHLD